DRHFVTETGPVPRVLERPSRRRAHFRREILAEKSDSHKESGMGNGRWGVGEAIRSRAASTIPHSLLPTPQLLSADSVTERLAVVHTEFEADGSRGTCHAEVGEVPALRWLLRMLSSFDHAHAVGAERLDPR